MLMICGVYFFPCDTLLACYSWLGWLGGLGDGCSILGSATCLSPSLYCYRVGPRGRGRAGCLIRHVCFGAFHCTITTPRLYARCSRHLPYLLCAGHKYPGFGRLIRYFFWVCGWVGRGWLY